MVHHLMSDQASELMRMKARCFRFVSVSNEMQLWHDLCIWINHRLDATLHCCILTCYTIHSYIKPTHSLIEYLDNTAYTDYQNQSESQVTAGTAKYGCHA